MSEEKRNKFLHGKTAVVTGASKRLGRAISTALAQAGSDIVIHDRHSLEGECEHLCAELGELGVRTWIVPGDFDTHADYESLIQRSLDLAGKLDIVVNNASLFLGDNIQEADFGNLMRHVQINAWASFFIGREFARLAKRGKIINMLDTRIAGYDWKHVSYILSKHMLHVLTHMMAIEFAPDITVNSIAPGLVLPPSGRDISYLEQLASTVPLKRHGGPDDVSAAVLYLLQNNFITGQTLFIDGGRHLLETRDGPHNN